MLVLFVERATKALRGNDNGWDDDCVYKCPSPGWLARVHPAVTGSEVSGSLVFLKKIREAELKWSTSGLWTEDHKVSWSMKQGEERYRGSERGRVGWLKREPNKRGEELCVMSVFPCQSYFEMWLNSPPSVRLVYGLRAAKPPTERTWSWHIIAKTQAVYSLDVWIIFCIIKLFKKHKAKTICMDIMCLRWKIVSLSIKVNPYCLNFLQTKELVSLFLP